MGFRTYLLYVFMVFVRPIEQFAPDLMEYRPVLILWILTFLTSVADAKRRGGGAATKQHYWMLLGVVFAVILSVLFTSGISFVGAAVGVVSTPVMLFVLTCLNVDTLERFRTLSRVFLLCVILLCLQSLAAYHMGVNVSELVIPQLARENVIIPKELPSVPADDISGAYIWRLRSVGFLNDPNDFGQTVLVVLPWLFMQLPEGVSFIRGLLLTGPWLALMGYVMSLTHSRGAMIGLAASVAFYMSAKLSRWKMMLLGGVAAVVLLSSGVIGGGDRALSGKEQSASERIDAWNDGILMLKSNPLLGVGYGNFTEHHIRTAHNSFVLCFAEIGLFGYFLWMGLIVLAMKSLGRVIECVDPGDVHGRYALLLRTSIFGFLVCAWFLSRTFVPTLYILAGMAVSLLYSARQAFPEKQLPALHKPVVWGRTTAATVLVTLVLVSVFIRFSRV